MSPRWTSPLNSRVTYKTAYSASPVGCLIDISELLCQNLPSGNPATSSTLFLADQTKALDPLGCLSVCLTPNPICREILPTLSSISIHPASKLFTPHQPPQLRSQTQSFSSEYYTGFQTDFSTCILVSFSLFSTQHQQDLSKTCSRPCDSST